MDSPCCFPPVNPSIQVQQQRLMVSNENFQKPVHVQNPNPSTTTANKRKRSLPGTPDPEAQVVALSPTALLATNRFVCEICGKGFQRDQNLQLHRRGHNLPWKLRQRSSTDVVRRKVYVCPEETCVHHDPSRALGDLTGIKKHFSRKHGEKKWKCEKCSKRYAVQSDWKAHVKTCGTREYKCQCSTIFSRRDAFLTHKAFCDALSPPKSGTPAIRPVVGASAYNSEFGDLGRSCISPLDQINSELVYPGDFQLQLCSYPNELRVIPGRDCVRQQAGRGACLSSPSASILSPETGILSSESSMPIDLDTDLMTSNDVRSGMLHYISFGYL